MPFGVEHVAAIELADFYYSQLSQPLMPFGVEHGADEDTGVDPGVLSQPLMPFGVEHIKQGKNLILLAIYVPTFDAFWR